MPDIPVRRIRRLPGSVNVGSGWVTRWEEPREHGSMHRRARLPGLRQAGRPGNRCSTSGTAPSPTSHGVVGCQFSSRLTQGPAVSVADRHHSLRLDMLTMTRSAYLQVGCGCAQASSDPARPNESPARTAHTKNPGSARTRRRLGDQGRPQPAAISARQSLGDHRVTPAVGLRPMPPSSAGPTAGRVWRPRRPAGPLPPWSAWALGGRGLLIRCGRCPLHLEGSTLRPGLDLNEVSKPTASARSLTCVYARLRGVVGG